MKTKIFSIAASFLIVTSAMAYDCKIKSFEGTLEAGEAFSAVIEGRNITLESDFVGTCEGYLKDYTFWYTVSKAKMTGRNCKVTPFEVTFLFNFPQKAGSLMVTTNKFEVDEYSCQ